MSELKKILVVDDEADVRLILKKRLSAHKFQVLEAPDGMSGIAVAKEERPDLILLDIMMPGKDGIETFHALKGDPDTKEIPVIFLTGLSPDDQLSDQGLELIAATKHNLKLNQRYAILGKPYDPRELIHEVRRALGEGEENP